MNRLSRRQFLRASGTVAGATMVPSLALSRRVGAAEKALIPKKMPFPPNDEFGSYEPTITPDGNTIYFARFAGSGDSWAEVAQEIPAGASMVSVHLPGHHPQVPVLAQGCVELVLESGARGRFCPSRRSRPSDRRGKALAPGIEPVG